MTSQYRHRRTSSASTVFPTLEPGEIAVNTANRQIAIGDAAGGTTGAPLPALALRFFDTRAQYAIGDLVYQNNIVYRAKVAVSPGVFTPAQWDMLVGSPDPQYVLKAGDVMTGALSLPAANPTAGVHATHKTYVDTLVASKSTIYASTSPPAGVPDNSIWMETDTGVAYFRYNDGDSTQWMILSPQIDTTLFVLKSGDTMGGPLNLVSPPTQPLHAASKAYVDTRASVVSSDTPPPAPIDNTLWYETDTGLFFIRFNDGTSAQWCAIAANAGDAVRYDAAQTLTSAQAAQARANIWVTKKNYIINGGMQVSQENGSTANSSPIVYYPVDMFYRNITITPVIISIVQVASPTPGGSPNRIRNTVTTADATMTTNERVVIICGIEGLRAADLKCGTAAAKTVTIQFGVKAPAGTYCVAVGNYNGDRCYIAEYIISAGEANTDVVKSVTLQLDTTGTWAADTTGQIWVYWTLMAGPTWQKSAGSWGAGEFYCSANQFNFAGTNGNVFELFDVSMTEGTVAPPFQLPDYAAELALCKRYYRKTIATSAGAASATTIYGMISAEGIRAQPTLGVTGVVNFTDIFTASYGQSVPQITMQAYYTGSDCMLVSFANFTGVPTGRPLMWNTGTSVIIVNARL